MTLVDTSVWISYFNGASTRETQLLENLIDSDQIVINELILTEVLQGISDEKEYQLVKSVLLSLSFESMGEKEIAVMSAGYYRELRKKGITIRKTIDCLIASFCIMKQIRILHNDKDFEPFTVHFGLKAV